jgi:hypothetical protein
MSQVEAKQELWDIRVDWALVPAKLLAPPTVPVKPLTRWKRPESLHMKSRGSRSGEGETGEGNTDPTRNQARRARSERAVIDRE